MRRSLAAPGVATAIMLLAACGSTATPAASVSSTTPPPAVSSPSATTTPSAPPSSLAGHWWPVATLAQAIDVQAAVDAGRQPWLLDPEEVAIAYAGAELGWSAPQVVRADGGTVELRDTSSGRLTALTLTQPVRKGPTGIWVVTGTQQR
ncbi:MAG: hypothetical protein H0W01_17185 [Pseudonocardiales bacterium]|nr:hypothetical protein [Pseudonocardiales bacterium]